jgi:histidyl-tRNA synthetase
VISVNDKFRDNVLEIVQMLREKSVKTDYDLRSRSLSKQLEYASSLGIPFTAIVGEKELKENSVKLRNMRTGKEEMIKIKELVKKF